MILIPNRWYSKRLVGMPIAAIGTHVCAVVIIVVIIMWTKKKC